jgi:putative oxidoreductase
MTFRLGGQAMLTRLLETSSGVGMLWARLPLAVIMIQHGVGKVLNLPGFIQFCDNLGVPPVFAVLAAFGEFFGGLGLLLGGLTRIAAFGVGCTMAVAAVTRHIIPGYGFEMNWHGALPYATEGFEFHAVAVGISLGLMFAGAGRVSLDYWLATLLARRRSAAPPRPVAVAGRAQAAAR